MHSTYNIDDGYFGSGKILKRSIAKYGIEHHTKEILHWASSREELVNLEKQIVNESLINDPLSMNLRLGGEGGGGWTREQQRENNRKSQTRQQWLREHDEKWAKRESDNSRETFQRMRAEGKIPPPPNWTGRKHSDATKKKLSRIKSAQYQGEGNPQYGKRWICNPVTMENKQVLDDEVSRFISSGWSTGKITEENRKFCKCCNVPFKSKNGRESCSRNCSFELKRQETNKKEQENIHLVLSSSINFSRYGWCAQVAQLINKDVMYIKRWMKRHLPEFYETNCYKRNS
jgi:hypothetical protein